MAQLHDFQFFTLETLAIQTLILILIIWVLNKFVFQPYLQYLDEEMAKREKLENDYNNIEKLNQEAQEKREEILSQARVEADAIRQSAKDLAQIEANTVKQKAQDEVTALKNSAQAEILKEKQTMLADVKAKCVDLILKFNAKLFDKEAVNKDFVEKELHAIK